MWLRWVVGVAAALFLLETATAAAIASWPALKQRFWATVASQIPSSAKPVLADLKPSTQPPSQALLAKAKVDAPAFAPSMGQAVVSKAIPTVTRQLASKRSAASTPPAPTARPSSREAEIALYSRALAQLNVERDPATALGTLGVYEFKYPNGILRNEATIARVKADVMLGLNAEALELLDAMNEQAFAGFPKRSEARLLRAELLVRARRCEEALQTLGQYLEPSAVPEQRGQALILRASCRSQLNDLEGSRDDLRTYLREFPNGPLATTAMETMKSLP
jgi:hypothetical protein